MPKIIWPINPFIAEEERLNQNVLKTVKAIAEATRSEVIPVFAVSPAELMLALDFDIKHLGVLKKTAEFEISEMFKEIQFKELKKPVVLVERKSSITASVKRLVNFATKSKASLIICGTKAVKGIDRLLLGSFAENLIHQSKTPTLLVNPNLESSFQFKRLLFATDFSLASQKAWKAFCVFASKLNATEVEILHVFSPGADYALLRINRWFPEGLVFVPKFHERRVKDAREKAQKLIAQAEKMKVKASFSLVESNSRVADLVQERARRSNTELIALAIRGGYWLSMVLGSTTRSLIQNSRLPVWLFPSSPK
jgi:nucleotide-binding universal stress UspA family protein